MTWPLWMALLLVLSAMFAGAEAALFTLASSDPEDRPASANQLLRNPGSTLTLILIGNLLINLSYFGASAAWSAELSGSHAAFVALGAVLVLVV
ncbi:MAG: CNNM domain-containing protein, partial [Planctomycetes bacterium]|nr:CNNM domain-containing protein [Planctomycetota bacterium]